MEPLPDHIGDLPIPAKLVPGAAFATVTVFVVAFALMSVFYWWRDWARRVTRAVVGLVSLKLADWLSGRVEQVADGLGFHVPKGYIYSAMAFSALVEGLNMLSRRRSRGGEPDEKAPFEPPAGA